MIQIHIKYLLLSLFVNMAFFLGVAVGSYSPTKAEAKAVRATEEKTDILLPLEIKMIPARISWYGDKFDGKLTASGQIFNMDIVSAAHTSLPFGTMVRFFNPANNRQCDAVVNDSGPFDPNMLPNLEPHPRRQFDASKALAECLEFIEEGVANIYVTGTYNERPLTYEEIHSGKITRSDERFAKNAN
ncbi:MAG: hypothetical protein HYX22_03370 [Candidatus Yanofskybacteria bacterium]|nr:hypothetical protein [Candidatus Yanofskybacteria bacterium]